MHRALSGHPASHTGGRVITPVKASSQLAARVTVPSIGFTWTSDPIETSSAGFAIIGEQANGKYYTAK